MAAPNHPYNTGAQAPSIFSGGPGAQHHPQQQQQQQFQQTHLPPVQQHQLSKEVTSVSLCRLGQETVHDSVQKATDVFQNLKTTQLPNGVTVTYQNYQEKSTKLKEQLGQLQSTFKRLRLIYDKVKELSSNQGDDTSAESLIPVIGKEQNESLMNAEKSDMYQLVSDEHREMVERIRLKSCQLKEVIDHIRKIIWEINTMITMRKTG